MPILKRNGKTFSGTPTKVDTAKSYTTFDSADDKNPTTWSDVELLTSKEEQRSLFSKISTMFKNIRYLYKMLGTIDISNIGDGTVTGGIDAIGNKLGNTDISGIGDGTVTGGLDALNSNLLIKGYIDKNIGDVQLNSYGYLDIRDHMPTNKTVVLAGIKTFGASANARCFNITADGWYIIGGGSDSISNLMIRYYYS